MPFGPTWPRSSDWPSATPGARSVNGSPAARHLLLLRLADLHQVQAAALDDTVEGHRGDHPGGGPGDDDAAAEYLRADDQRCQGGQVRRADRVAGEGTRDRSTGRKQPGGEEGRRAVPDRPDA